jgi:hypothetical protein
MLDFFGTPLVTLQGMLLEHIRLIPKNITGAWMFSAT